jgi:2,3-bisphosphoglycerate-independent phosphoglycerate mutase
MFNRPKPLVLLILDGFGYRKANEHNAIAVANTPFWDQLQEDWPTTLLHCSGKNVGLPDGQMGNSEVGHITIGSGRFVPQDLSRVNIAISDNSFFSNTALCGAAEKAINKGKALHIFGLLSPGGVHSHIDQILAMIDLAAKKGLTKIYLHGFLDGRDVPPKSAAESIAQIEAKFSKLGFGQFASIIGRFYAMDRDSRWERVEEAYNLIVGGESTYQAKSASQGLDQAYERDETDEFVSATAILDKNGQPILLDPEDSVVFMNFRADRAREISQAITHPEFTGFERKYPAYIGEFVTLTEYHQDYPYPAAFPNMEINNGLGEVLAKQGMKQLRLAETEKYAHVTFFLNGGVDEPVPGEDRILVPSPKVKTYDLQPEMNASEVTDHLVEAINGGKYDVIICNYANCDMVGHTGKWEPALRAVETIDASLQKIVAALQSVEGQMLVTADHGNIEQMVNEETGEPFTSHTTNLVPLLHYGGGGELIEGGSLSDLAPTMLDILDIQKPVEMTGKSLLNR